MEERQSEKTIKRGFNSFDHEKIEKGVFGDFSIASLNALSEKPVICASAGVESPPN